jgi:hypothetical protein
MEDTSFSGQPVAAGEQFRGDRQDQHQGDQRQGRRPGAGRCVFGRVPGLLEDIERQGGLVAAERVVVDSGGAAL